MTVVNYATGEVIDLDRAAAERRAERIDMHCAAIREASADLRALGYRDGRGRGDSQHLYFIEAVGAGVVKIGKASDVLNRLRTLQTGNACELRLLGVARDRGADESRWHRAFSGQRVRGEWFRLDETLRACLMIEVTCQ